MLVLTFQSHYFALQALESLEKKEGFSFKLAATPRLISSSCSSCLISKGAREVERNELEEESKTFFESLEGLEGIFILENNKKRVIYERD